MTTIVDTLLTGLDLSSTPPAAGPMPQNLIIPLREPMLAFDAAVADLGLRPSDYNTVARQIIDLFLNFGRKARLSFAHLPDCSEFVTPSIQDDPVKYSILRAAVQALAYEIELVILGLNTFHSRYDGREDFPYFFRGWYGHDAILDYMPF